MPLKKYKWNILPVTGSNSRLEPACCVVKSLEPDTSLDPSLSILHFIIINFPYFIFFHLLNVKKTIECTRGSFLIHLSIYSAIHSISRCFFFYSFNLSSPLSHFSEAGNFTPRHETRLNDDDSNVANAAFHHLSCWNLHQSSCRGSLFWQNRFCDSDPSWGGLSLTQGYPSVQNTGWFETGSRWIRNPESSDCQWRTYVAQTW